MRNPGRRWPSNTTRKFFPCVYIAVINYSRLRIDRTTQCKIPENPISIMKTRLLFIATAGLLLAPAVWSAEKEKPVPASRVEATFFEPEKFTDFKDSYQYTERGRDNLISRFTAHLESLARTYVPEGAKLMIKFTDIDLAGEFEPWHGVNYTDVRIIKDIYIPRLTFDFQVIGADGKVMSEGHRELRGLGFQLNSTGFASDPLRYEKDMLTDWARSEFRPKK